MSTCLVLSSPLLRRLLVVVRKFYLVFVSSISGSRLVSGFMLARVPVVAREVAGPKGVEGGATDEYGPINFDILQSWSLSPPSMSPPLLFSSRSRSRSCLFLSVNGELVVERYSSSRALASCLRNFRPTMFISPRLLQFDLVLVLYSCRKSVALPCPLYPQGASRRTSPPTNCSRLCTLNKQNRLLMPFAQVQHRSAGSASGECGDGGVEYGNTRIRVLVKDSGSARGPIIASSPFNVLCSLLTTDRGGNIDVAECGRTAWEVEV
jgi:hypothetical protein